MAYNHKEIEKKWQKYWEEHKAFKTDAHDFSKPKFYGLIEFPYPSGNGLHVGHPKSNTAIDIISRKRRMKYEIWCMFLIAIMLIRKDWMDSV